MANGPSTTETRHLRTLFAVGAAGCLTDGQLLERFAARSGDPSELAFAALVERHGSMVLRVARATLGDEHSAHDAFQATFLILARKARSLWVRDSLGPWLHAVAFRVASHSRSAEARRRHHERRASGPEAFDSRYSARSDLLRTIHEEIERLPQPYRLAILTCHLEGLTQHEAAHRLGWPVGTLQSRLARGRQRLREGLERRGLAPSLGVLAAKLAPVPHALIASTAKAASTLKLGGAITGMIPSTVLAMIGTTTKGMLMTKLKFGAVALVMALGVVGSGVGFGVGRPARATDGPPAVGKIEVTSRSTTVPFEPGESPPIPEDEPGLTNPKPWETVVRVKHTIDLEESLAWGVIVKSTTTESIILTSASGFRGKVIKGHYQGGISVDLLNDKLKASGSDLAAELVDLNPRLDIALIRIRPGCQLPASPVVPPDWTPRKGMKMYSFGCSTGKIASTWDTTIIEPAYPLKDRAGLPTLDHGRPEQERPTPETVVMMKCANQPKPGRSGGGLYTADGYVAGICHFADPADQTGLYSSPESIRLMLDRQEMGDLYRRKAPVSPRTDVEDVTLNDPAPKMEEPKKQDPREPSLSTLPPPRPWETVVRIKILHEDGNPNVSSGTVIRSTGKEAIILTSANNFKIRGVGTQPPTAHFRAKISVEHFDGKLIGRDPAKLGPSRETSNGELIACDFENDLALVRILSSRLIPASQVIDIDKDPKEGAKVYALGCSNGDDATAWETTILDSTVRISVPANNGPMITVKCAFEPKPGRSGGGLYTTDGDLMGVCLFADPNEHVGLYAHPETIRNFLDRNNLIPVWGGDGLKTKKLEWRPTPSEPFRYLNRTENAPTERNPKDSPDIEPIPPPTVSDQDKRINDLERKLDRVLKALEDLKGDRTPDGPVGDFPRKR